MGVPVGRSETCALREVRNIIHRQRVVKHPRVPPNLWLTYLGGPFAALRVSVARVTPLVLFAHVSVLCLFLSCLTCILAGRHSNTACAQCSVLLLCRVRVQYGPSTRTVSSPAQHGTVNRGPPLRGEETDGRSHRAETVVRCGIYLQAEK